MNKKAIAILGAIFILIVGTLGFLIYSKYGKKTPAPITQNPPEETAQVVVPEPVVIPETSKFSKLIEDQVVSPALFFNGKGLAYFDLQGRLYQVKFEDGSVKPVIAEKKALDVEPRANISKVLWPKKGDHFIAEFNGGGQKSLSFYDSDNVKYVDLPPQISAIDWFPGGDSVLFIWTENNKSTLAIGNPDTTNWKKVSDLWELDDQISVSPDGKNILFYETSATGTTNSINLVTPDAKVWKSLVKEGYNYGVLWSPDSQKFLFGKQDKNTRKYQLWYYDFSTGEVKSLGLFTTPEKAVWGKDSQTVYAAVPVTGSAGESGLTIDEFYKLNTSTLEKESFADSNFTLDGRNLFLSNAEDILFFKNAQDGGLYTLNLIKK